MEIEGDSHQSETNRFLSLVLDSLQIAFYICKSEGDFGATYITKNITSITGYHPDDFTSNSSFWKNNIHPDDIERVFDNLTLLFKQGYHKHEYRWKISDGSYRWFYDILQLVKGEDGTNVIGTFIDVPERKKIEEEIESTKIKLEKALSNVKTLKGLLPICSVCKKIRDGDGYWTHIESYVKDHSDASFTHGFCPDCHKIEMDKLRLK